MGFRCINCGGNIVFDIDSQSMKCQHCGSKIRPEQFEVEKAIRGREQQQRRRYFREGIENVYLQRLRSRAAGNR